MQTLPYSKSCWFAGEYTMSFICVERNIDFCFYQVPNRTQLSETGEEVIPLSSNYSAVGAGDACSAVNSMRASEAALDDKQAVPAAVLKPTENSRGREKKTDFISLSPASPKEPPRQLRHQKSCSQKPSIEHHAKKKVALKNLLSTIPRRLIVCTSKTGRWVYSSWIRGLAMLKEQKP
jgi:hypothetical protein